METLPWINGGIPWSKSWWRMIRRICDEHDILMVSDDCAVCWGKGGDYHGYKRYGVQPDISALGKSLTAGYTPLGCAVANKKVGDVIRNKDWTWGHTWQPTMTGISAMNAVNDIIVRENLFSKCQDIEDKLRSISEEFLDKKYITNYRLEGLLLSSDVHRDLSQEELQESGIVLTKTRNKSMRIIANFLWDDEFFYEMKNRLSNFFSINTTEG